MNNVLFSWLGITDLAAAKIEWAERGRGRAPDEVDRRRAAKDASDTGPVARTARARDFARIILLDDRGAGRLYANWVREWLVASRRNVPEIQVYPAALPRGPTNRDDIYRAARSVVEKERAANEQPQFLVSAGTPAMGAMWVLLAQRFNARIIESSREAGVQDLVIPPVDYENALLEGLRKTYRECYATGVRNGCILLAWLGNSDRQAMQPGDGLLGPVLGFAKQRCYAEIHLLDDDAERASEYREWLQRELGSATRIVSHPAKKSGTYAEILRQTNELIRQVRQEKQDPPMDFLVSPGSTNMSIAWLDATLRHPTKAQQWETWRKGSERIAPVVLPLMPDLDDPLERMWDRTQSWFGDPHANPEVPHNLAPHQIAPCKESFQDVWPWLPDEWFDSAESARLVHDAAKNLCGVCFEHGSRNITVGSGLLLVGMACAAGIGNVFPQRDADGKPKLINWAGYAGSKSSVLAPQPPEVARQAVRALFDVMVDMFTPRVGGGTVELEWTEEGQHLKLFLGWSGQPELGVAVREIIQTVLRGAASFGEVPRLRHKLLRLLLHMQIADTGFGCGSAIWMSENVLHIRGAGSR